MAIQRRAYIGLLTPSTRNEGSSAQDNCDDKGNAMLAIRLQATLLATTVVLGVAVMANAAPPTGQPIDPDMSKWYQSLKQPGTGTGCCSVADCRPYNSRIVGSHYEILDHQRWLVVPDNVVLHRENKAGAAIACLQTQWNYGFGPPPAGFSPDILCFIPGPEV
jgi:hypothetical protein